MSLNDYENTYLDKLQKEAKDQSVDEEITEKREEECSKQEIYGKRLQSGVILEACFDPEKQETFFAVMRQGAIQKARSWKEGGVQHLPPDPKNAMLTHDFVKLPSKAASYGSEAQLFQTIEDFLNKYLELPPKIQKLAASYVLFTWVYDAFRELPYLRAIGHYGMGKSHFLMTVGSLCYRPLFLNGSASVSSLFRMIDDVKGTMIFDEADFRFSDTTSEVVKILNSGFQKGFPVIRSEERKGKGGGKAFSPQTFDVFCPKVIATREDYTDYALESRCFTHIMQPMKRSDIPPNLPPSFEAEATSIRNRCLTYRLERMQQEVTLLPMPIQRISSRLRQIGTPVYSALQSKEGQEALLDFLKSKEEQSKNDRRESAEGQLLAVIVEIYRKNESPTMKELAEAYNADKSAKEELTAQKIGNIIQKHLHLQKKKMAQGMVLEQCKENDERLKKLQEQYGFSEPKMQGVQAVQASEKGDLLTATDIPKIFSVSHTEIATLENSSPENASWAERLHAEDHDLPF